MNAPESSSSQPSRPLLGLLGFSFYALFTLLPDSSTLMVAWPWVLMWQMALLCPVLWLMIQTWTDGGQRLGNGLDWITGMAVLAIVQSGVTAVFPQQARWAGIAALCMVAALYACTHYMGDRSRRQRLLTLQGLLQVAFIILSLGLWAFQTWLPELTRLRELQQATGVVMPFSFEAIENRNWAPVGHQNYVAGYLTLAIPSLLGLSLSRSGALRGIFALGAGLGLVDLYTTSSRAGWISLVGAIGIAGIAFLVKSDKTGTNWLTRFSKLQWLGLSFGAIGAIVLGLISTGRLNGIINAAAGGYLSGEFAYRLITNAVGWTMGLQSPLYGMGLGSVPHLFQKFRPIWAGREAELTFQLHSTPAQIWGELGILGLGLWLGTLIWLGRHWWNFRRVLSPLTHSLIAAIGSYSLQSFSDYQLDNLCISGTLVIFTAAIAAELRDLNPQPSQLSPKFSQASVFAMAGMTMAAILWLVPVHRAWMLSSQGFQSIASIENPETTPEQKQTSIVQFSQNLDGAHKLAPWEPYYPQQLAWVLGDLGLKSNRSDLLQQSVDWFNIARTSAPYQEFVYSNLGWLQLNTNPKDATEAFRQAAQLVPAKRGVFYGLGMSLLFQARMDVAIEALVLEVARDPIVLTSPWWATPQRKDLFQQVTKRTESLYTELINQAANRDLVTHLRGYRATLRWWTGDFQGAQEDAIASEFHALNAILMLQTNQPIDLTALAKKPNVSPSTIATLTAWLSPDQRINQLQTAWRLGAKEPLPPELLDKLQSTMTQSKSFDQWLKQNSPTRELRRQRSGFGVLSRHIDGVIPTDFLTVEENLAMTYLIRDIAYDWKYYPDLEKAIQVLRKKVLSAI
jgi:hypothetical protein